MLSTRTKIALARMAYRGIAGARGAVGLGSETVVTRDGLRWRLDLREGIDLAIFLFGMFERRTVLACRRRLRPGDVALDVGANIGALTLHLARCVGPSGRVFAFEPTAFAFRKLLTNIALNPAIAPRIVPEQVMLVDPRSSGLVPRLYSSWPLAGKSELHEEHRGRLMETTGARAMTLDGYTAAAGVASVDLIKLDVDGHECSVLRGAVETIKRHRPVILMELAPYVLREASQRLEDLVEIVTCLEYGFADQTTGAPLPDDPTRLRALIPDGAGINVVVEAR